MTIVVKKKIKNGKLFSAYFAKIFADFAVKESDKVKK